MTKKRSKKQSEAKQYKAEYDKAAKLYAEGDEKAIYAAVKAGTLLHEHLLLCPYCNKVQPVLDKQCLVCANEIKKSLMPPAEVATLCSITTRQLSIWASHFHESLSATATQKGAKRFFTPSDINMLQQAVEFRGAGYKLDRIASMLLRKSHKFVPEPYKDLGNAVLKNAISEWRGKSAQKRMAAAEWFRTTKGTHSCGFWCAVAGVDHDWFCEQLRNYKHIHMSGAVRKGLALDSATRPWKKAKRK